MKIFFRFIGILVFCFNSYSQNKINHYTTFDGLAHDITYGIIQDSQGFIWIGTDDGLSKFNGKSFKNYTINEGLSSNYVIDMDEFDNSDLAIATWRGGLHIFNREKDSFSILENSPKHLSNINIIGDKIYNYHLSMNQTFVFDDKGNYQVNINGFTNEGNYLKPLAKGADNSHSIRHVSIDNKIYAVATNYSKVKLKGLYKLHEDRYELTFPFLKNFVITSLAKVDDNSYIASTHKKLIWFTKDSIQKIRYLKGLKGDHIIKILPYNDKWCLLTVDDKGFKYAYIYENEGEKITDLIKFLNSNATVSDVLIDKESNLWVSSFGDGVYCILNNSTNISKIPINKNIIKIDFADKNTFFLSNKYLQLYDSSKKSIEDFQLIGFGKDIIAKNDTLFVTSLSVSNKVNKIKPQVLEISGYKYFKNKTFGDIIVNDSIRFLKTNRSCYFDKTIYNIFDAKTFNDTLYFATNIGLFQYNATKNILEKNKSIHSIIGKASVNAIVVHGNSLYLGTDKGLWEVKEEEAHLFDQKEGLIHNRINCLLKDNFNKIWVGTQKGLSIFNSKNQSFLNLTQESGLQSSYINHMIQNGDYIWIAGNKGVSIINNRTNNHSVNPPSLFIENNENELAYTTISYNRSQLKTSYKINDSPWIELPTSIGKLDVSNYKPGDYSIIFRSKKVDSKWIQSEPVFITIPAKWYQKWWVVFLVSISIPAIIMLLIYTQLKNSKRRNKKLESTIKKKDELEKELLSVRENISKDFHDDLGNKLARISIFSDILNDDNSQLDAQNKEILHQINEDANYIFKGTKDFVFSLQSKSDHLEEVVTYLSDFGEDYTKHLPIIFKVDKQINSVLKLPYYWSKQIIFIFKEVLTNAVKHSNCKHITYAFKYDNNSLFISCHDDGNGFNIEENKHGNGVSNIIERANKINCSLLITSEKDKGTTVIFEGKPH